MKKYANGWHSRRGHGVPSTPREDGLIAQRRRPCSQSRREVLAGAPLIDVASNQGGKRS